MNPYREGKKTSEFWGKTILQIVSIVLLVLVQTGTISTGEAEALNDAAITLSTILAPIVLEIFYTISRTLVKMRAAA